MSRPSDAKSRFAKAAAVLFRRKGYNGLGLTELIANSGAPKGSFYHHFPGGKEELGEVALRHAGNDVGRLIDRSFRGAKTFAEAASFFAGVVAEHFENSGWTDGCPVTSIAVDAVPGSRRLLSVTQDVLADWTTRASNHGERLGLTPREARRQAELLTILMEGAWIVARVTQSTKPFKAAAATFDRF